MINECRHRQPATHIDHTSITPHINQTIITHRSCINHTLITPAPCINRTAIKRPFSGKSVPIHGRPHYGTAIVWSVFPISRVLVGGFRVDMFEGHTGAVGCPKSFPQERTSTGSQGHTYMLRSRSRCWWLPDILENDKPTETQNRALASLYEALKVDLERRGFPPPPFQFTPKAYKYPDSAKTMVDMYQKWWRRIHEVSRQSESHISRNWMKVHSFEVIGICAAGYPIGALLRRWLPASRDKMLRAYLSAQVLSFLQSAGSHRVYPADVAWQASAPLVVVPGSERPLPSIGLMRSKKCRRKLVLLVGVKKECDQAAMSSSLQHEPYLSEGSYHLNRLFCLCAGWSGKESPNERWIGALKYLYHPVHGESTTTLVQRCRARSAGIRGGIVDDDFQQLLASRDPTSKFHPPSFGKA